jgi:imidazolonepropionase-like amidohydrolase
MQGKLGVIAPGALADMIVVDGDPMTDLSVFEHSARTVRLVMKDGRIARDRMH